MKVINCPHCQKRMAVTRLYCSRCDITVEGSFSSDRFALLSDATVDFIETFILARGSIKEIEKRLGISYPTVKAKVDAMAEEVELVKRMEQERTEQKAQAQQERQKRDAKVKDITKKE